MGTTEESPAVTAETALRHPPHEVGYHVRHALRGWRETPPSSVFGESVGINFGNVRREHIDAAMKHLSRHAVRHVRVEAGWAALDTEGNLTNEDVKATLAAARKYNIRPLVLLNAHEGVPCPTTELTVTLLRPFQSGDNGFYVSHEDAARIPLFRAGFSHEKEHEGQESPPYRACNVLCVDSWNFGGGPDTQTIIGLSRPLYRDIPAGAPLTLTVLASPPFFAIRRGDDGGLHPVQMQALHGWIGGYVAPLCRQLDEICGRGKYDVEVGNELMFGGSFFNATTEYVDETTRQRLKWEWGFHVLSDIVRRTVDHVHAYHPGTEIVNGFTSQNAWAMGGTEITAERLSRHYYVPAYLSPEGELFWYPEQTSSSDYQTDSMWQDLAPFNVGNERGRNNHSWNRDGSPGPAAVLTQTEGGSVTHYAAEATGKKMTAAEHMRLRAKWESRAYLWFAGKGGVNRDGRGSRYYAYTFREGDRVQFHQIAHPNLFKYLHDTGGVYPGSMGEPHLSAVENACTAPTFTVLKRLRSYLPIAPRITVNRQVSVERVSGGESTHLVPPNGPHGSLTAADMLTALPFQTGDRSFCIALYVQSLDLSEGDMEEERYELRFSGINWQEGVSSFRSVDVLTGKTAQFLFAPTKGTFIMQLTDCPRLLILKGV